MYDVNSGLAIAIRSEEFAVFDVLERPAAFHVVSIRDFGSESAPVDEVASLCLSMCVVNFDDLSDDELPTQEDIKSHRVCFPQREHLEAVLEYAEGKSPLLVHCAAGISRSSAVAYVIACNRVSPQEALGVLSPKLHWPNDRIVRLGADLLGNPEMVSAMTAWRENARLILSGTIFNFDEEI